MKMVQSCACLGLLSWLGLVALSCAQDGSEQVDLDPGGVPDSPVEADFALATTPINGILVCHVPPGNPAGRVTTWVPLAAIAAHLGHGDRLGPCHSQCLDIGGVCGDDEDCCSDVCNFGVCSTSPGACMDSGDACTFDHQCCSGSCHFGTCSSAPGACLSSGGACTFDHQCCSGSCHFGTCEGGHIGSCSPAGRTCTFDHQCCGSACIFGLCAP